MFDFISIEGISCSEKTSLLDELKKTDSRSIFFPTVSEKDTFLKFTSAKNVDLSNKYIKKYNL